MHRLQPGLRSALSIKVSPTNIAPQLFRELADLRAIRAVLDGRAAEMGT